MSVFYSDIEEDMLMGNTADIEYRGHLARIQRQMVALLPRYCLSDKLLKQVRSRESILSSFRLQKCVLLLNELNTPIFSVDYM